MERKCRARGEFTAGRVEINAYCQLPAGHEGEHVASEPLNGGGHVTYRWEKAAA